MFLGELIHSAYFGRLVRSLVKQLGIMAEAVGGYIVEKRPRAFPKESELVLGGEVPLAAKQEMDETNSLKSGLGCKCSGALSVSFLDFRSSTAAFPGSSCRISLFLAFARRSACGNQGRRSQ
jgi:hypothetical protein